MHKLGLPPFFLLFYFIYLFFFYYYYYYYYYSPSEFFHSLQPEVNIMLGKIKRLPDHWQ